MKKVDEQNHFVWKYRKRDSQKKFYFTPCSERRSVVKKLSSSLFVQIYVRHVILFCFDIGLPYSADGCITISQCIAYIREPNTTLTFDFKVKFIEFLTCLYVRTLTCFCFDFGLPCLVHESITMRGCIVCIDDTALTFDLKVKFKVFEMFSCRTCNYHCSSVCFDIVLSYEAHLSTTIRECVTYIYDSNTTLTFAV